MKDVFFIFIIFIFLMHVMYALPEPYSTSYYREGPYGGGNEIATEQNEEGTKAVTEKEQSTAKRESEESSVKGNELKKGACVTGCGDAKEKASETTVQSGEEQVRPKAAREEKKEEMFFQGEKKEKAYIPPLPEETKARIRPSLVIPLVLMVCLSLALLWKQRRDGKKVQNQKKKVLSHIMRQR